MHNLVRLLFLTELHIPQYIKCQIEDLNPHYLIPRYPDLEFKPKFSFTHNEKNAKKIINSAEKIVVCLKSKLERY
ncbi:HEPN domain-containing protein [Patescibacteria group bacterium]|nr:MAG: HEPN domain-containing protein [Patescibacteria group bacterium]